MTLIFTLAAVWCAASLLVAGARAWWATIEGKRVAFDSLHDGRIEVSTVWLGIDHNFSGEGPPLIFETMIFGGGLDGECWRYSTEAEAVEGHAKAVEWAQGGECP